MAVPPRPREFVQGRLRDRDAAYRPRLAGEFRGRFHANGGGFVRRAEHPGVIHFREVVIFGREPKHRNRGDAARGQLPGYVSRRDGFINRIRGTRK